MLVSKYADHLPLYRQAQIYGRQGINLDRSTLAAWVGKAAYELKPVFTALISDLKRSQKMSMDETRAPVLDPKAGKTKTGYFWEPARDDRPWSGAAPPGVAFTYAPGRSGQYADSILQGFSGVLQVDGYASYNGPFFGTRCIKISILVDSPKSRNIYQYISWRPLVGRPRLLRSRRCNRLGAGSDRKIWLRSTT